MQSCEKHGLQRKRRRKNCQFANRSKYVFCALLLFFRIERCCISCGWQLLAELSCCCSCPISSKPSLTWRPNSLTPIHPLSFPDCFIGEILPLVIVVCTAAVVSAYAAPALLSGVVGAQGFLLTPCCTGRSLEEGLSRGD